MQKFYLIYRVFIKNADIADVRKAIAGFLPVYFLGDRRDIFSDPKPG